MEELEEAFKKLADMISGKVYEPTPEELEADIKRWQSS